MSKLGVGNRKQAVAQATEDVVAEVQKQAKAAYVDLSQQLMASHVRRGFF